MYAPVTVYGGAQVINVDHVEALNLGPVQVTPSTPQSRPILYVGGAQVINIDHVETLNLGPVHVTSSRPQSRPISAPDIHINSE